MRNWPTRTSPPSHEDSPRREPPRSVLHALRQLGHTVDSVASLGLKGVDNGSLYRLAESYDILFTKDREFAANTRAYTSGSVKIIRVTIPQQPGQRFARVFIDAFSRTDWSVVTTGSDWPQDYEGKSPAAKATTEE
ncbi:MAG: DUF5615 family PIN-like protein [Armatimonadetes bacterium]|nr:DUF5615 family PIN-like protein [Armatimonadota bacterium]